MKKTTFLFLLTILSITLYASDSLQVGIAKKLLRHGDSIILSCSVSEAVKQKLPSTTLNVWLDNIATHQRWKFRYPVVDGEVNASIFIGKRIPEGQYAVNFLLQQGYVRINGEVIDHHKKDTAILSVMINRNKQSVANAVMLTTDGHFRTKSALFADSASFIFSPPGKVNRNYLMVRLETPLDSPFVPIVQETQFITIENLKKTVLLKGDSAKYVFNMEDEDEIGTLPGVRVTTKAKSKIDAFNEQYSHGMFLNPEALIIDGLNNSDLERSRNVFDFLRGRIPASYTSRGGQPSYYLDEILVQARDLSYLSPNEIAMIKIYRPPSHLNGDFFNGYEGVAIAVYTKQGIYRSGRGRHYFIVKGFTNLSSAWL